MHLGTMMNRGLFWLVRSETLLLGSMLMSLLAAELYLRHCPERFSIGYRPSPDDRLVYELEPGSEIREQGIKISEQGTNDRLYPAEKPPGVYRIVVVGDSVTFGWRVARAESM